MADEILEYCKERFNRVDAQLTRILDGLVRVNDAVSRVEMATAQAHADFVSLLHKLDRIEDRLRKIEEHGQ